MSTTNRQILLARRPKGFPQDSDFELVETPLGEPAEGEFLAQSLFLSVDPYMRGRMNDAAAYAEPVGIGEVMVGQVVARVVKSNHPKFSEGSIVAGMFGWQQYTISDGSGVRRINPEHAPVSTALHVLGMPGLTAYFGLLDVCDLREGDTVVVSGAAGAVGADGPGPRPAAFVRGTCSARTLSRSRRAPGSCFCRAGVLEVLALPE